MTVAEVPDHSFFVLETDIRKSEHPVYYRNGSYRHVKGMGLGGILTFDPISESTLNPRQKVLLLQIPFLRSS